MRIEKGTEQRRDIDVGRMLSVIVRCSLIAAEFSPHRRWGELATRYSSRTRVCVCVYYTYTYKNDPFSPGASSSSLLDGGRENPIASRRYTSL